MVFDQVEQLQREYTDKYVIVEGARPELARFEGQTGVVKTINMNGRALVEFDANSNIAWYDIALDYLRVIDKPLEKPEKKAEKEAPAPSEKPAAKAAAPAGEKKMSALEMARAQGAAKAGGAAATPKPAAAKPAAAPASGGAKKASTADILAAARANKGESAPTASAAADAPTAPAPAAAPAPKPTKPAAAAPGDISLQSSTADKIAWCRQHDAHG